MLAVAALTVVLIVPGVGATQPRGGTALDWDTGQNKSYVIPAVKIPVFILGLNLFDRLFLESDDADEYDSDWNSIKKNLRTAPALDRDPFSINQLGHPYQGATYYGFARSAGLGYWQSLLYTIGGSFLWETAGETTAPSLNDHVSTGIGGSFIGEALFRMSSLLLEGGGGTPGFWRELGAAVISPPTGLNRLLFGDRFDPVFPSRDPAIFVRSRLGASVTAGVRDEARSVDANEHEGIADFSMAYGLPGKPTYRYRRPFDYFSFNLTAVPNASSMADAVENVAIRGLLVGTAYEWGEDYRGVWGLFGGFDYLSPQIFRVSSTDVSLGTVAQWWLSRAVALQGTALAGVGFGAAGTVGDHDERDYHYGVIPQWLLGLRLIFGDLVAVEVLGRQFYVIGEAEGAGTKDRVGLDLINRGMAAVTVRVSGPHAFGIRYIASTRDARLAGLSDRHQSIETISLSYEFLGQGLLGAVEWRPGHLDR